MYNRLSIILLLLMAVACSAQSQNNPPQVYTPRLTLDAQAGTLTIEYALYDSDNSQVKVTLQLANDSGRVITPPESSLSGDVGYPVTVKDDNKIVWHYDPATFQQLGPGWIYARVIADDGEQSGVNVQAVVDSVSLDRMRNDLAEVVGIRNFTVDQEHIRKVKNGIQVVLANNIDAFAPRVQEFTYSGYTAGNIIAEKSGMTSPDSVIIIAAHFDTVEEAPGADDNGSGVVAVKEIVRVLKNMKFNRTVRFIFFDLEEEGLVGSRRYVSTIPSHETILGAIDYEMIGYASDEPNSQQMPAGFNLLFQKQYDSIAAHEFRGDFITNIANTNSIPLMTAFENSAQLHVPALRVISAAVPGTGSIAPDFRRSDHASFWDAGIPSIMLTDGANFRNPNYHTPGDTLGTINFEFMTKVVKATVATIIEQAGISHAGVNSAGFKFTTSGIEVASTTTYPDVYLGRNIPNPFSNSTVIDLSLPVRTHATLKVFDLLGREVATLINGMVDAGPLHVTLDSDQLGLVSGAYVYRLVAGETSQARMMVVQ